MFSKYNIRAISKQGLCVPLFRIASSTDDKGAGRAFASNLTRNEILAGYPVYLAAKERKDRKENRFLEVGPVYRDGDFKASRPQDL